MREPGYRVRPGLRFNPGPAFSLNTPMISFRFGTIIAYIRV